MATYTLQRTSSDSSGTFGQLFDVIRRVLCLTCELPWLNNHPQTSCIPNGTYNCINYSSPRHPNVWQLVNVSGRSEILIHSGNTELDSRGCIIVGDKMGTVNGLPAVMDSVKTLDYLKTTMPDIFELVITGVVG